MLLMHPVEWHLKEIEVPIEESKPLMSSNDNKVQVKIVAKSNDKNQTDIHGESASNESDLPQNPQKNGNHSSTTHDSVIQIKSDLDGLNDGVILKETRNKNSFMYKVIEFFDLSLLKDWRYLNIAIGITMSVDSDSIFFALLPMYLFGHGFTKKDAAAVIVTGSIGDIVSRITLAIISYNIQLKARHIYLAGVVFMLLTRIGFTSVFNFYGVSTLIVMISFFWCYATQTLVVAEYLPPQRFTSGYGLFLFINGIISFIITPFFGWIRDVTQSYIICYNTLTLLLPVCVIPWIVELLWFRSHPQKNKN